MDRKTAFRKEKMTGTEADGTQNYIPDRLFLPEFHVYNASTQGP